MQVLLVIVAVSTCIAGTALIADAILRAVLHLSLGRTVVTRTVLPGRVASDPRPAGVWHRDRL